MPHLRYRTMLLICLVSLLILWRVPLRTQGLEDLRALGSGARELLGGR